MKRPEIREYEDKCTQNYAPACITSCPMHVDVKMMIRYVEKGDFTGAANCYQKNIPFPRIVSRICDHPCQLVCKREEIGGSILISKLERACIEFGELKKKRIKPIKKTDKKIAIVGGGLSGLTAALFLYEKGYQVTVFEKEGKLGGRIRNRVKDGLLSEELIDADFKLLDDTDIQLRCNCQITDIEEQLGEKFDGVYDSRSKNLLIESGYGEDSIIQKICDGRSSAISLDRQIKGVSLTVGRENEVAYKTELYVNIDQIESRASTVTPGLLDGFTEAEAIKEAERCIQCECMECVKQCKFLETEGSYPKKYVREIANNVNIMMGIRKSKNMVNSCTLCGLCGEICPNGLNMADVSMSGKIGLAEKNHMPEAVHDFPVNDMLFANSNCFKLLRYQASMEESRYVFFPGCQLGALAPTHVLKAYQFLTENLRGGVGLYLGCCGAPAAWSGRVDLFNRTAEEVKNNWEKVGKPIVITACATCTKMFSEQIEGIQIESLWEIYDSCGAEIPGPIANTHSVITIHDACTARHDPKVHKAVRSLLKKKGYRIEEMKYSRDMTKCCSFGGLVSFTNTSLAKEMTDTRAMESDKDFVVYCAMCKERFTKEAKPSRHILDLIYDEPYKSGEQDHKYIISYSKRHENRIMLKRKLLKEIWGEEMEREKEPYEGINIKLTDEIERIMDDRLILVSDIKKVIYHAEDTGSKIWNPNNNHYTAKFQPGVITYWVEYSIEGDVYMIYKAYSHRLEINKKIEENAHRKYRL